jgi:hypothetical protein
MVGRKNKSQPFGSADYNTHQHAPLQRIQSRVKHRLWFPQPLSTRSMLKGQQLVDLVNIAVLPLQQKDLGLITWTLMCLNVTPNSDNFVSRFLRFRGKKKIILSLGATISHHT